MGSRRGQRWAVAALLVIAVVITSSAWGSPLRVLIRETPNKTESNRTTKTISGIVIHDTEGRFIGSVRFLQKARARGSAHFVVSRRGQIVQLVPVTDVAWHSGNSWWNLHSIGIEHEGWVGRRAYTKPEYRASAQLVAYLAHRWGVPIDRDHIIGHDEVPNPNHPGWFGGVSGHTDPGPYWNWGYYMGLVRYYSAHRVLPHFVHAMTLHDSPVPRLRRLTKTLTKVLTQTVVRATPVAVSAPLAPVRTAAPQSVVDRNATVHGKVLWWSGIDANHRWRRHIWKVDFIVDGTTLYTDHTWPYSFHRHEGWDSKTVANGRHMLTVLAYGAQHYRSRKHVAIRVDNPPLRVRVSGAVSGGAIDGVLSLHAQISEQVERVALYADGVAVSRDSTAPYTLSWDTRTAGEGAHHLLVYARGLHGRRAALELPVVVANAAIVPAALTRNWVTDVTSDR
jgi:N-acetyl-anhydromuramyl-L-alanine amidase AmpD